MQTNCIYYESLKMEKLKIEIQKLAKSLIIVGFVVKIGVKMLEYT